MADKAWKSFERRVAKLIGGERIPVSGRQRGYAADIAHPWLGVECKYRRKLPEWMTDAMRQAKASCNKHQMPIVIIGEKGDKTENAWAIVP